MSNVYSSLANILFRFARYQELNMLMSERGTWFNSPQLGNNITEKSNRNPWHKNYLKEGKYLNLFFLSAMYKKTQSPHFKTSTYQWMKRCWNKRSKQKEQCSHLKPLKIRSIVKRQYSSILESEIVLIEIVASLVLREGL